MEKILTKRPWYWKSQKEKQLILKMNRDEDKLKHMFFLYEVQKFEQEFKSKKTKK